MAPGAEYSLRELAGMLDISFIPIREALRTLGARAWSSCGPAAAPSSPRSASPTSGASTGCAGPWSRRSPPAPASC
ncbi:hypothetical protein ACFW64_22520 [Streptomyces albidoflavus]